MIPLMKIYKVNHLHDGSCINCNKVDADGNYPYDEVYILEMGEIKHPLCEECKDDLVNRLGEGAKCHRCGKRFKGSYCNHCDEADFIVHSVQGNILLIEMGDMTINGYDKRELDMFMKEWIEKKKVELERIRFAMEAAGKRRI